VGYDEGGQLTEAVRRHPYCVILFDEVEKAHPDVFNVLLQVLDDGRITDSQGRTVDFKNAILIMTSNLGSEYILDGIENGEIRPEARETVDRLLKTHFRPEFLNRIDEIVYYKPLTREEIRGIVGLMIANLNRRLETRQLKVELTDKAMDAVIERGFDPSFGARPLKRYLQAHVETLIARKVIAADVAPDTTLVVDADDHGDIFIR
jgi:ATP-dependent Clp protease ATP-binding subunit ClpB